MVTSELYDNFIRSRHHIAFGWVVPDSRKAQRQRLSSLWESSTHFGQYCHFTEYQDGGSIFFYSPDSDNSIHNLLYQSQEICRLLKTSNFQYYSNSILHHFSASPIGLVCTSYLYESILSIDIQG